MDRTILFFIQIFCILRTYTRNSSYHFSLWREAAKGGSMFLFFEVLQQQESMLWQCCHRPVLPFQLLFTPVRNFALLLQNFRNWSHFGPRIVALTCRGFFFCCCVLQKNVTENASNRHKTVETHPFPSLHDLRELSVCQPAAFYRLLERHSKPIQSWIWLKSQSNRFQHCPSWSGPDASTRHHLSSSGPCRAGGRCPVWPEVRRWLHHHQYSVLTHTSTLRKRNYDHSPNKSMQ